ncbi:hypothetical protein JCM33374_g2807 [Metschnikowia sp. JCM 33374]|nr:hypothetical protein JCM33374_g2807 [Metschnikowia sp. JCM 33374]
MNFLSSALSLISANSIPYTIKEKVVDPSVASYPENRSVWTVHNGINPKNDSQVSIFEFNLKDPANFNKAKLAINCFKKSKSIKFPGILSVVDFIENDSFLYVVTERITPLTEYLQQNGNKVSQDAKIYGIYNVSNALAFINTKANCLHGKLDVSSSVYVNAQGEWKLFGFELLTNLTSDPDQPIYRLSGNLPEFSENLPPEVANSGAEAIRNSPFKFDAYKLGVFILALFSTERYSSPYVLKSQTISGGTAAFAERSKLPRTLATSVMKLLTNQNSRINVEAFVQETQKFFHSNRLVKFSHLLDEIKFKGQAAKLSFFKTDISEFIKGDLPPGFLDHKVLPEIVHQYNIAANQKPTVNSTPEDHASRQETTSVLLNHILRLSSGLPDEIFAKTIKPIIFSAFSLSDRSIRLILLKYLPEFRIRLTDSEIQLKVFNNLLSGLQDTNFLIRETTLTSITSIIDKVSVKQVNQELLKILAKSQMDPKPSIRTNTLILIINISSKIYSNSRNSVIITALSKSLRDSFTPCKLAALSGFERLIDNFSLEEICSKILGHLAVSLMDPKSFKVRKESKRIFNLYLDSVEKHAASLPQNEEDEDAEEKEFYQNSSGPSGNTGSVVPEPKSSLSIGWSVVNRLVASESNPVNGTLDKAINRSTPEVTRISSPNVPQKETAEWDEASDYDDHWDDEEEILDDLSPSVTIPKSGVSAPSSVVSVKTPQRTTVQNPNISRLTIDSNQKSPGSTLKLDLEIDPEDDAWGDEW